METVVSAPQKLPPKLFSSVLDLIKTRSPVAQESLTERFTNAEQVIMMIDKGKVISTATIKNPLGSYKRRVFSEAGVVGEKDSYEIEVGYIATDKEYEGRKLCQSILSELLSLQGSRHIFATTREPAMMHILTKLGFKHLGKEYKDHLVLMVRSGRKDE